MDTGSLRATLYVCSAAELPSSCIRKRSAVRLPEKAAKTVAAELPDAYEDIWRNGKIFMGLRVDLSKVSARHVHELIEHRGVIARQHTSWLRTTNVSARSFSESLIPASSERASQQAPNRIIHSSIWIAIDKVGFSLLNC